MKLKMEVIGLDNCGDHVKVVLQGAAASQPEWRPLLKWDASVPEHIGRRYRLGQMLTIEVS